MWVTEPRKDRTDIGPLEQVMDSTAAHTHRGRGQADREFRSFRNTSQVLS